MATNTEDLEALVQHGSTSIVGSVKNAGRKLLAESDTFDLAACMTLLLLMLYAGDYWYLRQPVTILCIGAIIYRPLRQSTIFWLVTTVLLAAANYHNWYAIDNHKYLMTYWCLALYLSLHSANPAKTAALSAKYLIGLAFLLAALWKLVSSDYLDGTFFHYSLLLDARFESLTILLGNLSSSAHLANYANMKDLLHYSSTMTTVQLQSTPSIVLLANFITWWTIVLEGLIAIAFLVPLHVWLSKWRDGLLLLFVVTTYSIAPVIGFGWVLVIMGAVQSSLTSRNTRLAYLAAFVLLQVYMMPWQQIAGLLLTGQ